MSPKILEVSIVTRKKCVSSLFIISICVLIEYDMLILFPLLVVFRITTELDHSVWLFSSELHEPAGSKPEWLFAVEVLSKKVDQ